MVCKGGGKNIDKGDKCEIPGYQSVYYIWKCLRCINKSTKTDSEMFNNPVCTFYHIFTHSRRCWNERIVKGIRKICTWFFLIWNMTKSRSVLKGTTPGYVKGHPRVLFWKKKFATHKKRHLILKWKNISCCFKGIVRQLQEGSPIRLFSKPVWAENEPERWRARSPRRGPTPQTGPQTATCRIITIKYPEGPTST